MESRIIGNDYVRFGGGMPCYPSNRKHASYPAEGLLWARKLPEGLSW